MQCTHTQKQLSVHYSSPVPWMCFWGCLHYSASITEVWATKKDLPVCLPLCIAVNSVFYLHTINTQTVPAYIPNRFCHSRLVREGMKEYFTFSIIAFEFGLKEPHYSTELRFLCLCWTVSSVSLISNWKCRVLCFPQQRKHPPWNTICT